MGIEAYHIREEYFVPIQEPVDNTRGRKLKVYSCFEKLREVYFAIEEHKRNNDEFAEKFVQNCTNFLEDMERELQRLITDSQPNPTFLIG